MTRLALLVAVMFLANLAILSTDVGHDAYCWGRIDAIDPWCP
jgi:hypothetical protein